MAVRTILKQPEKNAQRDPGEKEGACYYCGKEGHLNWDCPQASKLPSAPCLICKGLHWKRDCPQMRRFQGSDSQDNQDWSCLGVPTQAPVLIIPEEPRVLITVGGQSVDFLLDTGATYSVFTESLAHFLPDPRPWWDCLDEPKGIISVILYAITEILCYFQTSFWLCQSLHHPFGEEYTDQFSFRSQRKAMPKNAQTTAQLHSSHTLVK